ncbi:MAG: ammonium transporter [Cyanobacteria bacterium P01_D01_bin.44]
MDINIDVIWLMLCAILVSTMQAGFCCLESGLVRAKNSINVAIKNLVDFCVSCTIFAAIGFRLMFGSSVVGLIGQTLPSNAAWANQDYAFFFFELAFCGTATTIVSGAVAERMSFLGYFVTSIILAGIIYPISGHWIWGGLWFETGSGWLARLGFHDFAGSTAVHAVGGWMALAAILIIGPRLGRFTPQPRQIDGHNLPIAVLGVFLLWFGWFGFNGGSTLAFTDKVPQILVNTAQGGAAGGMTALLTTWILHKRPKVPIVMNGVIGGLVSVTAGCDVMLPMAATCAGAIGGVLCTFSERAMSRARIDDAVGVVPAHLVCGIWGTLAVALWADPQQWVGDYSFGRVLGVQFLGVTAVGFYAFTVSFGLLWVLNWVFPFRVTAEQERIGLNISEHGASTSVQNLLASMNSHSVAGDFSQSVWVEPETDAAPIAAHYNRVLDKVNAMTQELVASREHLLAILNAPAFPIVISRIGDSRVYFINQRAAELFGFTLQESGRYQEIDFWENLVDRERFLSRLELGQPVSDFEAHLKRTDQTTFWSLISGIYMDYDGEDCILFSFNDISNRKIIEDKLRQLAHTDSLTGTYNRRFFLQLAETALLDCQLKTFPTTALMLDIDHFKQVNDTYGHATGDLAIKFVADIAARHLRDSDILGRFGGEEFSILLPVTPLKRATVIAERIRKSIEKREFHHQGQSVKLTASIGVAQAGLDDRIHDLLDQADQALYQAKKLGRNRVEHLWATEALPPI